MGQADCDHDKSLIIVDLRFVSQEPFVYHEFFMVREFRCWVVQVTDPRLIARIILKLLVRPSVKPIDGAKQLVFEVDGSGGNQSAGHVGL